MLFLIEKNVQDRQNKTNEVSLQRFVLFCRQQLLRAALYRSNDRLGIIATFALQSCIEDFSARLSCSPSISIYPDMASKREKWAEM